MRIQTVTRYEEFLSIKEEWNELLQRSLHPLVFLTHQWIDTWWKAFGEGKELFILLVYRGDELKAIAPLMIHEDEHNLTGRTKTGIKIRKIEFIANVHSNRADLIIDSDPAECCEAIVGFLFEVQRAWDMLSLEYLVGSSPTVGHLKGALDRRAVRYRQYFHMASPYVPIDCPWEDYFKSLDSRFRRNLSSRLKKLSEKGSVRLAVHSDAGALGETLEKVFDVAAKSWKADEGTALSSSSEYRRFYTDLAFTAVREKWLEIYILYLDEKPLVFDYCLRFGDRLLLLKTEFDESYRDYGIGNLLKWKQFEMIFGGSLVEFDFLGPSMPWKLYWSKGCEREHIRLHVFNRTYKGRFLDFFHGAKDALKRSLEKNGAE